MFERNPLPMWVFDLETLYFLEANLTAVAHYGYSRDEFLRMRITEIRPPEEAERVQQSSPSTVPTWRGTVTGSTGGRTAR